MVEADGLIFEIDQASTIEARKAKAKPKTKETKPKKIKTKKPKQIKMKAPKSKATKAPQSKPTKASKSKTTKAPKSKATKASKLKATQTKSAKGKTTAKPTSRKVLSTKVSVTSTDTSKACALPTGNKGDKVLLVRGKNAMQKLFLQVRISSKPKHNYLLLPQLMGNSLTLVLNLVHILSVDCLIRVHTT